MEDWDATRHPSELECTAKQHLVAQPLAAEGANKHEDIDPSMKRAPHCSQLPCSYAHHHCHHLAFLVRSRLKQQFVLCSSPPNMYDQTTILCTAVAMYANNATTEYSPELYPCRSRLPGPRALAPHLLGGLTRGCELCQAAAALASCSSSAERVRAGSICGCKCEGVCCSSACKHTGTPYYFFQAALCSAVPEQQHSFSLRPQNFGAVSIAIKSVKTNF